MHSISQAPFDLRVTSPKSSGEKVLVKALAVFVNREGNKKAPVKKINLPSSACPYV